MTISKGVEWGESIDRPAEMRSAASDAELVELVSAGDDPPITLSGGDLYHCVGSPSARPEMRRLPIDLIEVTVDGDTRRAASHVLIHRPLARGSMALGELVLISNVGWLNGRNVAPKAHPNDGKLDVIEASASFGVRQRLQAYRRLDTGTHVPHPDLRYRQLESVGFTFQVPMAVRIDGGRPTKARRVSVTVLADAASVVV